MTSETGPARPTQPLLALHARLLPDGQLTVPVPRGWTALAFPLRGSLLAGSLPHEGLLSFADDGDEVSVIAGSEGAEILLLAAPPLNEPVVMGGPFVMSTEAEIRQAYTDYRAGRFGAVPPAAT